MSDGREWVTMMVPTDYYEWLMDKLASVQLAHENAGEHEDAARCGWFTGVARAYTVPTHPRSELPAPVITASPRHADGPR